MNDLLEKYGGWPIVKGDRWKAENWDWTTVSQMISNDGLLDLILDLGIAIDLKNSTKNVLIVISSILIKKKFLLKEIYLNFYIYAD